MLAEVKLYMWPSHLSKSCINVRTKGRHLVRKVWLLIGIRKKLKAKTEGKGQKKNKVKWDIKTVKKVNELT